MSKVLKSMLIVFLCFSLITLLSGLIGCKTETAATTEGEKAETTTTATSTEKLSFEIGVQPNTLQPPWDEFVKAIDLRCAELSAMYNVNYTQVVKAPKEHASLEEQSAIFDDFIAQGIDVIAGVSVDPQSYSALAKRASEAGITVGLIVETNDVPYVAFRVTTDDVKAAEECAKRMIKDFNGEATIMFLHGQKEHAVDIARYTGYMNVFKDNPGMKILAEGEAKWQAMEASTVMDDWIAGYGDEMDAVITANDNMAIGVIASMKAAGKKYYVAGWDGTTDGAKAILAGDLVYSLDQDFSLFGKMIADAGFQAITTDGMVRPVWIVPHRLVDKTNIQQMLDRIDNTIKGIKSW